MQKNLQNMQNLRGSQSSLHRDRPASAYLPQNSPHAQVNNKFITSTKLKCASVPLLCFFHFVCIPNIYIMFSDDSWHGWNAGTISVF